MNRSTIIRLVLFILVTTLLAACGGQPSPTPLPTAQPTQVEGRRIVLGDISDDPIGAIEEGQPLADYLAANLGDFGIVEGRVVVASNMAEMAELVASGQVDLYFDSVYPATVVSDQTGAQIFIRRWKKGVAEYHTMILTSQDSGITSVEELVGHTFGVEDTYSTSGYMLPLSYLRMNGLNVTEGGSPDETVAADQVAYVFTGDDENTVQWVLTGRVAAGAIENGAYEELDPETRDQLVVLAETESLPRHVGMLRPGLEPELVQALTDLLINASDTEAGQAALVAFSKTSRFDEFPEGIEAATERIRELVEFVRDSQ